MASGGCFLCGVGKICDAAAPDQESFLCSSSTVSAPPALRCLDQAGSVSAEPVPFTIASRPARSQICLAWSAQLQVRLEDVAIFVGLRSSFFEQKGRTPICPLNSAKKTSRRTGLAVSLSGWSYSPLIVGLGMLRAFPFLSHKTCLGPSAGILTLSASEAHAWRCAFAPEVLLLLWLRHGIFLLTFPEVHHHPAAVIFVLPTQSQSLLVLPPHDPPGQSGVPAAAAPTTGESLTKSLRNLALPKLATTGSPPELSTELRVESR